MKKKTLFWVILIMIILIANSALAQWWKVEPAVILPGKFFNYYLDEVSDTLIDPERDNIYLSFVCIQGPQENSEAISIDYDLLIHQVFICTPDENQYRMNSASNNLTSCIEIYYKLPHGTSVFDCSLLFKSEKEELIFPLSLVYVPPKDQGAINAPPADAQPLQLTNYLSLTPSSLVADSNVFTPVPEVTPRPDVGYQEDITKTEDFNDREVFIGNLETFLTDTLTDISNSMKDPVAQAICEGGVSGLSISATYKIGSDKPVKIAFYLKSLTPQKSSMHKYEQDPFFYWQQLLEAINEYSLKLSMTIKIKDGSFSMTDMARSTLESIVVKAAVEARKVINESTTKLPIMDLVAPMPLQVTDKTTAIKEEKYSNLFTDFVEHYPIGYSSRSLANAILMLKDGTLKFGENANELLLTFKGPENIEEFMTTALQNTMYDMKRDPVAKDYSQEQIINKLIDNLDLLVLEYRKNKKAPSREYTFSLPFYKQFNSETWYKPIETYIDGFMMAFEPTAEDAQAQTYNLPDYPVANEPKTGWLSGTKSGTQVILKIPKDDFARYVEFRNHDDNKILSCFIRAGARTTVKIPQGEYYLLIGAGDTWYGTGHIFGENASYNKTEYFQVPSSQYTYTLTLQPVANTDDGIPIHNVDLYDLLNGG